MRITEGHGQNGFTLIGLLILVAVLGIALAAVGHVWQTTAQREREQELLFIGNAFRQALKSYEEQTPEGQPTRPANLNALLQDPRFPTPVRHLRKLYRDPITGDPRWGLLKEADGIRGVFSLSTSQPLKTRGFSDENSSFTGKKRYADWVFALPEAQ